jgi:hypothetical protein
MQAIACTGFAFARWIEFWDGERPLVTMTAVCFATIESPSLPV